MVDCCEHGTENSCSLKVGEFHDWNPLCANYGFLRDSGLCRKLVAFSSAQEIDQKAIRGLTDKKRVDFQMRFELWQYRWSKCMWRKAVTPTLTNLGFIHVPCATNYA